MSRIVIVIIIQIKLAVKICFYKHVVEYVHYSLSLVISQYFSIPKSLNVFRNGPNRFCSHPVADVLHGISLSFCSVSV
jgi:hypothetical protein